MFTVPLSEIHTTPLPGVPAPVPLTPGASGDLYMSRAAWEVTTADGFRLYGNDHAVFKLPMCAGVPARWLSTLSVVPTSIVVYGHIEGESRFLNFEMLGPDAAESQTIVWNSADYLELRLTPERAGRLGLRPPRTTAKVWPIRLVVKGCPAVDLAVSGEVDLLDHEKADGMQRIAFTSRGEPITLSLTQDGVSAFHVTPQYVAERASGCAGAVPCPGCAQQEALSNAGRVPA